MNCINTNDAQYVELLEQSKLNPLILKARISIFQDKNGLESYPKLEDITKSETIEKVENIFENLKGSKKNELDWNEFQRTSEIKESDYSNENNRILFNNQQGKITVDEILNNILNNYKNLSPIGRELLEKSRRLVGRTGAKFQFISESALTDQYTVMQIDSDTNTIQANRQRLSKFTTDEVVETFLHELAHAQSLQA